MLAPLRLPRSYASVRAREVAAEHASNSASGTTLTSDAFSVRAGDLIVVASHFEDTGPTTNVITDSVGNVYRQITRSDWTGSGAYTETFFALARSSASITVTQTLGGARVWRDVNVGVFRIPSGFRWKYNGAYHDTWASNGVNAFSAPLGEAESALAVFINGRYSGYTPTLPARYQFTAVGGAQNPSFAWRPIERAAPREYVFNPDGSAYTLTLATWSIVAEEVLFTSRPQDALSLYQSSPLDFPPRSYRILGSGGRVYRVGAVSHQFSMCGWFRVHNDRAGAWRYFMGVELNGANTSGYWIGWTNSDTADITGTGVSGGTSPATWPRDGQWFFAFMRRSGTAIQVAWASRRGGPWNAGNRTASTDVTTLDRVVWGNDSWDEWCGVDVAYPRFWNGRALSDAEFRREMWSPEPVSRPGLLIAGAGRERQITPKVHLLHTTGTSMGVGATAPMLRPYVPEFRTAAAKRGHWKTTHYKPTVTAVDIGSGNDPHTQMLRVPPRCTSVVVTVDYYPDRTITATLGGRPPDASELLPNNDSVGFYVWNNPPKGSALLSIDYSAAISAGNVGFAYFVCDAQPFKKRQGFWDWETNSDQPTVVRGLQAGDLLLYHWGRYSPASLPALRAGWKNLATSTTGATPLWARAAYKYATAGVETLADIEADSYEAHVLMAFRPIEPRFEWVSTEPISSNDVLLVVQEALHAHAVDNVALTQANILAIAEAIHAHTVDNVTLDAGAVTLTTQEAAHAHTVDNVALTQANTLAAQEAAHAHTVDHVALVQANVLVMADALHAHAADNVVLDQSNLLVVSEALHGHTADNVALTQANILALADALHGHTADNVALTQANILAVAEALHGHAVDNVVLTSGLVLSVAEVLHAHTADQVSLVQANILVVQEALHGHQVDNVNLGQAYTLVVAEAVHAHTAEAPTLTQANLLAIQEALHAHLADNLSLTQASTLVVSDALHSLLSDNIIFPGTVFQAKRVVIIRGFDRLAVMSKFDRITTVH